MRTLKFKGEPDLPGSPHFTFKIINLFTSECIRIIKLNIAPEVKRIPFVAGGEQPTKNGCSVKSNRLAYLFFGFSAFKRFHIKNNSNYF